MSDGKTSFAPRRFDEEGYVIIPRNAKIRGPRPPTENELPPITKNEAWGRGIRFYRPPGHTCPGGHVEAIHKLNPKTGKSEGCLHCRRVKERERKREEANKLKRIEEKKQFDGTLRSQ